MRLFINMYLLTSNIETTNKPLGTSLVSPKHCLKSLSKDFCKLKSSAQITVHRVNYCIQYIYNKTCWLTRKIAILHQTRVYHSTTSWDLDNYCMHIKSTTFKIKHSKCVYFVKIIAITYFKVPSMCLHRLLILK